MPCRKRPAGHAPPHGGMLLVNPSIIEGGEIRSEPTRLRQRMRYWEGQADAFKAVLPDLPYRSSVPGLWLFPRLAFCVVRHACHGAGHGQARVAPALAVPVPSRVTFSFPSNSSGPCALARGEPIGCKPHWEALPFRLPSANRSPPRPRCSSVIQSKRCLATALAEAVYLLHSALARISVLCATSVKEKSNISQSTVEADGHPRPL